MKKIAIFTTFLFIVLTGTLRAQNEKSLKMIMFDLGADMEAIVRGINYGDFNAIEAHAKKIANHDKPTASQMHKVISLLGDEAASFKKGDAKVHSSAVSVAEAAAKKDYNKIVEGYGVLLGGCVACHATYRSRIVEHFKEK